MHTRAERTHIVMSEADDDDTVLFGEDGLVDVPAALEGGQELRGARVSPVLCCVRADCTALTAEVIAQVVEVLVD